MSFIPCVIVSQGFRSNGQRRQYHVGLIQVGQVPAELCHASPTEEFEIVQIQALIAVVKVTHCVYELKDAMKYVCVLQKLDILDVDRRDTSVIRRSFKRASFAQVAWDMDVDIRPGLPRMRRIPYLADRREQRV
jgi:hypothetical protein